MSSDITLYRCTECGELSLSLGGLHGHIESHRPIWRFWQSGSTDYLTNRTEVIRVTNYQVEPYIERGNQK